MTGSSGLGATLNRRDTYMKESAHLHNSHNLINDQINIAIETREHLNSQRQYLKRAQTRFNDMANRFPLINRYNKIEFIINLPVTTPLESITFYLQSSSKDPHEEATGLVNCRLHHRHLYIPVAGLYVQLIELCYIDTRLPCQRSQRVGEGTDLYRAIIKWLCGR